MAQKKLTSKYLKQLIAEERTKLINQGHIQETLETGVADTEKVKAEEVDADEFAGTLAKDVDFIKSLKIEEARLTTRLNTLREMKSRVIAKISRKLE